MSEPFEGKAEEFSDDILDRVPVEYFQRKFVLGLAEVAAGVRVNVPTTVYVVTGDDTSGVAGVLRPDGEFIAARGPRQTAKFWEFDETLKYETVPHHDLEKGGEKVVGNSWTSGEVVWDGSVAGSINLLGLDGEEGDELRQQVSRREWEASVTGDWASTGELWRAIRRGTGQAGQTMGVQHNERQSHRENEWDTFGGRREAA